MVKKGQHFVLKRLDDRKQTGRKDKKALALQIAAADITKAGVGGGIVNLLLPDTPEAIKTLNQVKQLYFSELVEKRKPGKRQRARDLTRNDQLMVSLAQMYHDAALGISTRMKVNLFSRWICQQLINPKSDVYDLVWQHDPYLTTRIGPDWWAQQIATRRRQLKLAEMKKP